MQHAIVVIVSPGTANLEHELTCFTLVFPGLDSQDEVLYEVGSTVRAMHIEALAVFLRFEVVAQLQDRSQTAAPLVSAAPGLPPPTEANKRAVLLYGQTVDGRTSLHYLPAIAEAPDGNIKLGAPTDLTHLASADNPLTAFFEGYFEATEPGLDN